MLKCLTWTIPTNICPEYVTGTVFSHSSYGGGHICARPICKFTPGKLDLVRPKYEAQSLSNLQKLLLSMSHFLLIVSYQDANTLYHSTSYDCTFHSR